MVTATGYAARHGFSRLKPIEIERDPPKANEVQIDILCCGICHSNINQCENDWGNTVYPCMPGHEVVGRISAKGASVTKHEVGDVVGVRCMIDSCHACGPCKAGDQQYREGPNSWLATYNGPMSRLRKRRPAPTCMAATIVSAAVPMGSSCARISC